MPCCQNAGGKTIKKIEVTDEFLAAQGHTRESYEALSSTGKWAVRNREKSRKQSKEQYDKNPQLWRDGWLRRKYGITQTEYERLYSIQGGRCAICATEQPEGRYDVLVVDHCHKDGSVRGLLCDACNLGLGKFKDDTQALREAISYLERNAK